MYIVHKLDEIFCRHQLGPFDLWCDLDVGFLYFLFGWPIFWLWGLLKAPTTTMLEFIYVFMSFWVCLMKLGILILGAYRLIIVISFWCISPFISMKCPSLSYLINVGLMSTLS
jgi:hypothetical protein